MSDTLRGAALMVVAMACFAVEDALIKGLTATLPATQIIWMLGLGGALAFAAWLAATGRGVWSAQYLHRTVLMRSGCEVFGTLCFVSALALIPLALASAVIQATPLVVAMGAALFLGAPVGWRRWAAIAVGFAGVMLIIRPGAAGVEPGVLLAVGGMLGLAARDLVTRTMPGAVSGPRLSLHAFAALVPTGLALQLLLAAPFVMPSGAEIGILAIGVAIGMGAYLTIVAATRMGDIAVISSFRYSRMLFALLLGVTFFGERPDAATLAGVTIVIASGLYTLIREARLRRAASQA
ncbi:DMT family transporter [Jannaschia ovalis]|uniref:DMT family transporter n=1 Tax=Jannaschia ovalis TaxID=3038773 RepID=A0ABY8LAW5_9RHOB|nr:DMT family transporter [Jannaschia sp. GRR-S6-38]WGH78473.1 DMT family transporter [Jannaschia sp. GRR-S6-38]